MSGKKGGINRKKLNLHRRWTDDPAAARRPNPKLLHVYGQEAGHDPVFIVGTRAALLDLRAAVMSALTIGRGAQAAVATDGEPYALHVRLDDTPWAGKSWQGVSLPYVSSEASDRRKPNHKPTTVSIRGNGARSGR